MYFQHNVKIERYARLEYIPQKDIDRFYRVKGGKKIIHSFLEKFFSWGAVLWIAKVNDELIGYYWTIKRGFDGFYNFPMTSGDSVLVAGEVFPTYRGRGINPEMIHKIAHELKKDGITRIFIGSKIWNIAQLRSLTKTGFKKLGTVRMFNFFGKYITVWGRKELKGNSEK